MPTNPLCGVAGERFDLLDFQIPGDCSDVWRARDRTTGAIVALKIPRRALARAQAVVARELAVRAQIDHSTLPRLVDADVSGPTPYIVMEFRNGVPIGPSTLRVSAVRSMAIDLLSLVHALEESGLEHPALATHVLVEPDGKIAVCGLGATRALERADVMRFDVGQLLYWALTGEREPQTSIDNPYASAAKAIADRAPAALALDPILIGVIDALVQHDPEERADPVALMELLGLPASTVRSTGIENEHVLRRVRQLFGFVLP